MEHVHADERESASHQHVRSPAKQGNIGQKQNGTRAREPNKTDTHVAETATGEAETMSLCVTRRESVSSSLATSVGPLSSLKPEISAGSSSNAIVCTRREIGTVTCRQEGTRSLRNSAEEGEDRP